MSDALILAAGLGTRMKSCRAKVLHELGGKPLIAYVVDAVLGLSPRSLTTVVGHQAAEVEGAVRSAVSRRGDRRPTTAVELRFALQPEQRGTGHAVAAARSILEEIKGPLLVLAGDGPMIRDETLKSLLDVHESNGNDVTLLTAEMHVPTGYGRVIRDSNGNFDRIVEEKDASASELLQREVCVSIYAFEVSALLEALDRLGADNAQAEYYLTDVPAIAKRQGRKVGLLCHGDADELVGVNTRVELAELERRVQESRRRKLMLSGVTLVDPSTVYVGEEVDIGQDTVIHPHVILEGRTRIGSGCTIHSWTRLKDVEIGSGVTIRNSSVLEDAVIREGAIVGPFSRLRAGADIGEKAVIGNFVEVKKSVVGARTKASHLTYLGDATIGEDVNIGAGTVTCNYDGERKHQTIIEDDVKIGSDTMLVAPVKVGRGSKSGAGSVITRDVPPDTLVTGVPAKVKKKLK